MAKGKGAGKKGKAPELSPEEAAALRREQQIAAKADLRRRMEEEAKNSKINGMKILNQWRKIMRLAKTESLKKDIEIISQNHERDVDRKDAILQMIDRDLEEAEEQYQMSFRANQVSIDQLIKLHDTRLYSLERGFQTELATMQNDFNKEKDVIQTKFAQEKKEMLAIIEAVEAEEEECENEARHQFEQLREEIRNRNGEDINMLRISLDAQIEELEQQFETAHLNYLQETAQRTHDFKELTQNDQRLDDEIYKKRKEVDGLQTTIQQWKAKIRTLMRDGEERNRLLLEEKLSMQKHYQQLKQRIQVYRGSQNQRLLQLTQSANSCKDKLKSKLDLAKQILNLAELSRNMETTYEMILPFAPAEVDGLEDSTIHGEKEVPEQEEKVEDDLSEEDAIMEGKSLQKLKDAKNKKFDVPPLHQSSAWSHNQRPINPPDRLSNFYRKYNHVLMDTIGIEKERDRLSQENDQLQDLIQQFISGTKLDETVLDDANPLFVINGRANLNHNPPVRMVKPTIQSANAITSSTSKQYTAMPR